MVESSSRDSPYRSDDERGVGNTFDLANTLRILKVEIRSCKADNDIIIQAQEKQAQVNVVILQSLSELQ